MRVRRSINLEFLLVKVPGHEGRDINVFVNGVRKGRAGRVLTVQPGRAVRISVELPGAVEKVVDIQGTDLDVPLVVEF